MSIPLANFPLARTSDPDEAQCILSRELSDLRINSIAERRRFHLEMNGVQLGRTSIAFNRFSTETEVDAGVIHNAVIVSVSVGPPTTVRLDDEVVGPDRVGVVSPTKRLRVHRAQGSGVLFLRTSLDAVAEKYRELTGKHVGKPMTFASSVNLHQGVGSQIHRLLTYLVDDAASADTVLQNPILKAGLDDALLTAILALPNGLGEVLRSRNQPSLAPSLVARAEEYLKANATEAITIADVVAECGCSRRALFDVFQRHRGYTPIQFLKQSRMELARGKLLQAGPTDTVTSISLSCGFSHLGRFAEAYHKQFGEQPSETIRRP